MYAFYRRGSDGAILNARQVREELCPRRGNLMVILPADEANWKSEILRQHGIEGVLPTDKPAKDERFYVLDGRRAALVDGQWVQHWAVSRRFDSKESLIRAMKAIIEARLKAALAAGVEIHGLWVGGDGVALEELRGEPLVQGGVVFQFAEPEAEEIKQAYLAHRINLHRKAVDLIEQIGSADNPIEVDIDSDWP